MNANARESTIEEGLISVHSRSFAVAYDGLRFRRLEVNGPVIQTLNPRPYTLLYFNISFPSYPDGVCAPK